MPGDELEGVVEEHSKAYNQSDHNAEWDDADNDNGNSKILDGKVNEGEDEDEEVRIVGKKRKALHNKYDPKKARKRKMRDYYGKGTVPSFLVLHCTICVLLRVSYNASNHVQGTAFQSPRRLC